MSDEPKILGVNERHYPLCTERGQVSRFPVLVVLVEGDIEDYAAYVGAGDPSDIARFGDKISFKEACIHFPGGQLKRERYRD